MLGYSLGHLAHHVLLRDLAALVTRDRATTATLLAHIAEVDKRRLYANRHGSMFDHCVKVLGFSEDAAGKRITATRVARRFPAIFVAIEDGWLHVTAVCLLSRPQRHLRGTDASELIAAAEHKTNDEIREMLVERFPQPDLAPRVSAPSAEPPECCVLSPHALERVEVPGTSSAEGIGAGAQAQSAATGSAVLAAPTIPISQASSGRTTPLSPGRFGLQLTMSTETRDKLRRAEELLGHAVPRGEYAQVLDRALDALIEKLERRRFAATHRPRDARPSKNPRHIPAGVRRAVRARDGEQCTFVGDSGERCEERKALEFDHVTPVARGGESTVANLRLRCRTHNQWEAERTFGAGFMQAKRARAALQGESQVASPCAAPA